MYQGACIWSFLPTVFWYLQGSAALAIALLALSISWQQQRTNSSKLKLDLFELRYRVYDEVIRVLKLCYPNSTIKLSDIETFYSNTVQSKFLFGSEIEQYLQEICDHTRSLENVQYELSTALRGVPGRDREQIIDEQRSEMKWIEIQFNAAKEKFKKYLDFTKL
jgi:hypothetical protein